MESRDPDLPGCGPGSLQKGNRNVMLCKEMFVGSDLEATDITGAHIPLARTRQRPCQMQGRLGNIIVPAWQLCSKLLILAWEGSRNL